MKFSIYGTKISPNRSKDNIGQLICSNVPVARTGTQEYYGYEMKGNNVDPSIDNDKIYTVYRLEEDLMSDASIASLENKPITYEHPKKLITATGDLKIKDVDIGFCRDIRIKTIDNKKYLIADLVIKDENVIEMIENHEVEEISCGYTCDFVEIDGKYYQKNFIFNHVAVVERGRAGTTKIGDSKKGVNNLTIDETKKTLKEVLKEFFNGKNVSDENIISINQEKDKEPDEEKDSCASKEKDEAPKEPETKEPEENTEDESEGKEEKKEEEPKAQDEMANKIKDLDERIKKMEDAINKLVTKDSKPEETKSEDSAVTKDNKKVEDSAEQFSNFVAYDNIMIRTNDKDYEDREEKIIENAKKRGHR